MNWIVFMGTERRGQFKYAKDAAALVAALGYGATIRYEGSIVWAEGKEDQSAAHSYDHVAEVAAWRLQCWFSTT